MRDDKINELIPDVDRVDSACGVLYSISGVEKQTIYLRKAVQALICQNKSVKNIMEVQKYETSVFNLLNARYIDNIKLIEQITAEDGR